MSTEQIALDQQLRIKELLAGAGNVFRGRDQLQSAAWGLLSQSVAADSLPVHGKDRSFCRQNRQKSARRSVSCPFMKAPPSGSKGTRFLPLQFFSQGLPVCLYSRGNRVQDVSASQSRFVPAVEGELDDGPAGRGANDGRR